MNFRKKMNKTHIIIFVAVVFFICNCSKKEETSLLKEFSMNQYIDSYFASPEDFDIHSNIKYPEILRDLYQKNQNESFWFTDNRPNMQSEQLLNLLANSMNYGLDTMLYNLPAIRCFQQGFTQDTLIVNKNKLSMLGYELCLTQSAVLFFSHLKRGIMQFNPLDYITNETIDSTSSYFKIYNYFDDFLQDSLINIAYHAFKNDSIEETIDMLQPQNPHYKRLQKALENYLQNNPINRDSIQVVYYEKDTVWTSTFDNYGKACLALQKLKWSNITAKQYIFINVPSFTLDFVEENILALSHKIICGTPKNQTPELNSRLSQIRLFPEWNVPLSIATKEILPMVQKNTKYLVRNNFEVLDNKGNILDPDSVPWKKYSENYLPVKIRQTTGSHNSLGTIMFYFDNASWIYFHDTPAKGLFNRAFRAFSHGCIRLQNPFAFADVIMEFDDGILHLPKDSLMKMKLYETQKRKKQDYDEKKECDSVYITFQNKIQEKESHTYDVKKNIRIYIRYLTAYCNENNQLCFAPDFYGRDSVLMLRYNEAVEEAVTQITTSQVILSDK